MAKQFADLAGEVPKLATAADIYPEIQGRTRPTKHAQDVRAKSPGKINLKHVAEACADAGLDPAAEILRVLTERVPVLDRSGQPVLDPNTGEPMTVDRVDPDTRLRTLNELLQYTQPKLKAVEVKVNGNLELSGDQLDQRLASLIAKAAK
jgi:hypothetical protein